MTTKIIKNKTDYGYCGQGQSHFVFVAPHAGGDDLKTAFLAIKLARIFAGSFVVNRRFFKQSNSRSQKYPERVEDFNRLSWSKKNNKYLWAKKNPAMKKFFADISELCNLAKQKSPWGKAVVVYLHGMNSDKYLFDLGVGLRAKKDHQNKFRGTSAVPFSVSGVPTMPISILKKLKNCFVEEINNFDSTKAVGVGVFPAWSRRVAIQFHKNGGRDDFALQLEINHEIRINQEKLQQALLIIENVFKKVF
ncbi:MAG: hypothetical protein WCT18_02435 [Patescibacteria group bacterium]